MAIYIDRARQTADNIVARIKPYCERIEVAGSIRRNVRMVNDIDIVLIPSDPWNLHSEILFLSRPFKPDVSGPKIMRVKIQTIPVDFYFATKDNWYTLLLIRTGSTQHNIRLCALAKKKGWHLAANGDGLFDQNGSRFAGDTEESIFEALGIPFRPPQNRR